MDDCSHCNDFDTVWKKLSKSHPHITMEKIKRNDQNNNLIKKYKILKYPSIILLKGNKNIRYNKKKKDIKLLTNFLNKNINMV